MAEAVIGEPPNFPVGLSWDDLNDTYESLRDLGIDLEYVEEHEYRGTYEPKPVFTDFSGARYRILVFALEVTLCVRVPDDYDPSQLRLVTVVDRDREIVVEVLGDVARQDSWQGRYVGLEGESEHGKTTSDSGGEEDPDRVERDRWRDEHR